jgi:hypothetical protein
MFNIARSVMIPGMELTCYELLASGKFGHFFEDRFPCRSLEFLQNVSGQAKLYL